MWGYSFIDNVSTQIDYDNGEIINEMRSTHIYQMVFQKKKDV